MTSFAIYASLFIILIYANRFFGLFKDDKLSGTTLSFVFLLKTLAVPAFFLLFKMVYGGIEKLDAGKFYSDAVVMNKLVYIDFKEYLKMLVGLQDDSQGSFFFKTCIDTTNNWDNGRIKDFFYNDNRIVIRVHSLLHFIAFGSYFVHALFSCFLSFTGLFFIYKTFKSFFKGTETLLFFIICLFPTLWLYTGGLLKEGITIFVLGVLLHNIKRLLEGRVKFKHIILLLFLAFISLLLKPYILFFAVIYFSIFFLIERTTLRFKSSVFFFVIIIVAIGSNYASLLFKNKTLVAAAYKREMEFADLSTGGIFLLDSVKFVRLPYDTTLVEAVPGKKDFFKIKLNAPFTYWEHSHQQDTLYCKANPDAVTTYSLVYILPKAGSAVNVIHASSNPFVVIGRSFYYSTLHPLFYNTHGAIQKLASLENLVLAFALIIVIFGCVRQRQQSFPAFALALFAIFIFILVGFTTPNSGAIIRYRAPAAIFILMSALYFLKDLKFFSRKPK